MTKPLCIYHANCADGFGGAWVVRKFLGAGTVEFFPANYGEAPPNVAGREVIMVDFSYKRAVIEDMAKSAKSILILDHHKTARDDLTGYKMVPEALIHEIYEPPLGGWMPDTGVAVTFDMERSGAMIAWDHFFPQQTPPQLLKHIQDRDLWLFKLEGTREIQANLFSYPYDFALWDELMAMDVAGLIAGGVAIERKHHKDIGELLPVTTRQMRIGGIDMPVANLPYTLASDAGNALARSTEVRCAAVYFDSPDGRKFSIRSTPDGPDVSVIAAVYGGGGHRNAAGFRCPIGWEGEEI